MSFLAPLPDGAQRHFDNLWRDPGSVVGGAWRRSTQHLLQCLLYHVEQRLGGCLERILSEPQHQVTMMLAS